MILSLVDMCDLLNLKIARTSLEPDKKSDDASSDDVDLDTNVDLDLPDLTVLVYPKRPWPSQQD